MQATAFDGGAQAVGTRFRSSPGSSARCCWQVYAEGGGAGTPAGCCVARPRLLQAGGGATSSRSGYEGSRLDARRAAMLVVGTASGCGRRWPLRDGGRPDARAAAMAATPEPGRHRRSRRRSTVLRARRAWRAFEVVVAAPRRGRARRPRPSQHPSAGRARGGRAGAGKRARLPAGAATQAVWVSADAVRHAPTSRRRAACPSRRLRARSWPAAWHRSERRRLPPASRLMIARRRRPALAASFGTRRATRAARAPSTRSAVRARQTHHRVLGELDGRFVVRAPRCGRASRAAAGRARLRARRGAAVVGGAQSSARRCRRYSSANSAALAMASSRSSDALGAPPLASRSAGGQMSSWRAPLPRHASALARPLLVTRRAREIARARPSGAVNRARQTARRALASARPRPSPRPKIERILNLCAVTGTLHLPDAQARNAGGAALRGSEARNVRKQLGHRRRGQDPRPRRTERSAGAHRAARRAAARLRTSSA